MESHNTLVMRSMWERVVENKDQFVNLMTWNDYSENTHIRPSQQTASLFGLICKYYSNILKGVPEAGMPFFVALCSRAGSLTPGRLVLRGEGEIENSVEVVYYLPRGASVAIETGGRSLLGVQEQAGLGSLRLPLAAGRTEVVVAMAGERRRFVSQRVIGPPVSSALYGAEVFLL